jgi:tRNA A-37 threonylcarbamoyl transferase component Bud32
MGGYEERFQVLEEVGEGGFARVYRAREKTTGKKVALKVLKDAYRADPEIVERFRREVFAVASISSPHVVAMRDFGISGDEIYIAMEYVEGPTLRELIYERFWTASDIHVMIGQIAQALAAAHREKIVHRDLKPENVMLVPGPNNTRIVKVLDFGLAKLAELERKLELEPLTRAGMCFGTPQYMAPELIQGKPFDKSVDLYALGIICFEMVGGYLPWDGSDPRQILLSVVKNPPPHLTKSHPSVRLAEMDHFLQRVLSKEKSQRPADAAALFGELEVALFGKKRPARVAGVPKADAPFASVWAAPLELRTTGEDMTEIDMGQRFAPPPLDPTGVGGGTGAGQSGVRRRKLQSGWMSGLSQTDSIDSTIRDLGPAIPAALKEAASRVVEDPTAPKPLPPPPSPPARLARTHHSRGDATDVIKDSQNHHDAQRRLMMWLIPLLVGLVVFAAALGYFLGRQSH